MQRVLQGNYGTWSNWIFLNARLFCELVSSSRHDWLFFVLNVNNFLSQSAVSDIQIRNFLRTRKFLRCEQSWLLRLGKVWSSYWMIPAHKITAHPKKSSYFKSRNFPVAHVASLVFFLRIFISVCGHGMEVTFGELSTFSHLVDYQKPLIWLTLPSFWSMFTISVPLFVSYLHVTHTDIKLHENI